MAGSWRVVLFLAVVAWSAVVRASGGFLGRIVDLDVEGGVPVYERLVREASPARPFVLYVYSERCLLKQVSPCENLEHVFQALAAEEGKKPATAKVHFTYAKLNADNGIYAGVLRTLKVSKFPGVHFFPSAKSVHCTQSIERVKAALSKLGMLGQPTSPTSLNSMLRHQGRPPSSFHYRVGEVSFVDLVQESFGCERERMGSRSTAAAGRFSPGLPPAMPSEKITGPPQPFGGAREISTAHT